MIETRKNRTYIERLRNDPRTRALADAWVNQAMMEAEQHYDSYREGAAFAHYAARRAVELAMSFVLDNDGELAATREQLERALETQLQFLRTQPVTVTLVDAPQKA